MPHFRLVMISRAQEKSLLEQVVQFLKGIFLFGGRGSSGTLGKDKVVTEVCPVP